MTAYETLTFSAADGIGWLTLNRPDRLNAMTNRMVVETHDCLRETTECSDVRVLVLTGAGRGFCPGADLKHFAAGAEDIATEPHHFQVPVLLHEMPQITIAAINGACAERLAAASPHALRTMKQNFLDAESLPLDRYVEVETARHLEVMAHDDAGEAFRAFVEKRPPRFRGV